MNRFVLLISAFLLYFLANGQITITNKLVKDSLKSRINDIHTKIYKAIESGRLEIYDSEGKPKNPATVLSPCISSDSIDCDSSKVSINEFRNFSFNYLKTFDYETLNTSLKVESLDILYRIIFAGVKLSGSPVYKFQYKSLSNILEQKDIDFLKYLSIIYHDIYYYRNEDSISFNNNHKSKVQIVIYDEDYTFNEAKRSKESLDTGYSYRITFDSVEIEIVSKILFYQFEKKRFKKNSFSIFNDKLLKKDVKSEDFLDDLFNLEYEWEPYYDTALHQTFSDFYSPHDESYIRKLILNGQYFEIEFSLYPNDKLGNLGTFMGNDVYLVNKPLQTYYFKPEDLPTFLGKFQYLFLKNLFGF